MSNSERISQEKDNVENNTEDKQKVKKRKTAKKESLAATVNRRSAQASRTSKACESCRKQKTRCFRSPENSNSCFRCAFLSKHCSFEDTPHANFLQDHQNPTFNLEKELNTINNGINVIIGMLKGGQAISTGDAQLILDAASSMKKTNGIPSLENSASAKSTNDDFGELANQEELVKEEEESTGSSTFHSPTNSFKTSPFSVIANQIDISQVPLSVANLMNLSVIPLNTHNEFYSTKDDLISLAILSENETIHLMDDFRRNYGRWTSFPQDMPTSLLIERIRSKSPLLLTTCCCLSLRYSLNGVSPGNIDNFIRKRKQFQTLIRQLLRELNKSLFKYASFQGSTDNSGDIEFLQALVILSIYSPSLSSIVSHRDDNVVGLDDDTLDMSVAELNLDPWYLSGIGLTTFISKSTFGSLFQLKRDVSSPTKEIIESNLPFTFLYDELDSDEYQTLTILRIYNHLTLVHLINCVFSGRMCVLDEIRLNYCTATLSLPSSTNFDGRMVSEIGILLIAYNYIQVILNADESATLGDCEDSFANVKEEVKNWFEQWEYLFSQPALQFVELCYDFCSLLIYYNYNYQKYYVLADVSKQSTPLYEEDNINFILSHCDKPSLMKIFEHSNNVVRIINIIESDSYFAYLSDQLHFCFYFSALCLIKVISFLRLTDQDSILRNVYSEDEIFDNGVVEDSIKDIKCLIEKYARVGQNNPNDIISKYKAGLETCLNRSTLN